MTFIMLPSLPHNYEVILFFSRNALQSFFGTVSLIGSSLANMPTFEHFITWGSTLKKMFKKQCLVCLLPNYF